MRDCTFSPALNPRSLEILQAKGPREAVEDKAGRIQRLKQERLRTLRELEEVRRIEREAEECTFHPEISRRSK